MKIKTAKKKISEEEYYDKRGVLSEIIEEDVAISLDEALGRYIVMGKGTMLENSRARFLIL